MQNNILNQFKNRFDTNKPLCPRFLSLNAFTKHIHMIYACIKRFNTIVYQQVTIGTFLFFKNRQLFRLKTGCTGAQKRFFFSSDGGLLIRLTPPKHLHNSSN